MSATKPTCAVRGVLFGGRALCGSGGLGGVCHSKQPCEHKREPQQDQNKTCLGCGAKFTTIPEGGLPCGH